jgi:hypothetical protein
MLKPGEIGKLKSILLEAYNRRGFVTLLLDELGEQFEHYVPAESTFPEELSGFLAAFDRNDGKMGPLLKKLAEAGRPKHQLFEPFANRAIAEDLKKQGETPKHRDPIAENTQTGAVQSKAPSDAAKFVILYHDQDGAFADKLSTHMSMLKRRGKVELFLWGEAPLGSNLIEYVQKEVAGSHYILCLVSANFLNSEWLDMALDSGKRIIPILVRSTPLEGSGLEKLKILPADGRAIVSHSDEDGVYTEIVTELRKLLPS